MSGRAGRRGKDERGICIIMIDERVTLQLATAFFFFILLHQLFYSVNSVTIFYFFYSSANLEKVFC